MCDDLCLWRILGYYARSFLREFHWVIPTQSVNSRANLEPISNTPKIVACEFSYFYDFGWNMNLIWVESSRRRYLQKFHPCYILQRFNSQYYYIRGHILRQKVRGNYRIVILENILFCLLFPYSHTYLKNNLYDMPSYILNIYTV